MKITFGGAWLVPNLHVCRAGAIELGLCLFVPSDLISLYLAAPSSPQRGGLYDGLTERIADPEGSGRDAKDPRRALVWQRSQSSRGASGRIGPRRRGRGGGHVARAQGRSVNAPAGISRSYTRG
jgi:hypothetical protein